MKIYLLAVGKLKDSYVQGLLKRYEERLHWKLIMQEVAPASPAPIIQQKSQEGVALLQAIPNNCYVIALDEKGKQLSSPDFASLLESHMTLDGRDLCFVIGGSDGLATNILARADFKLSLGKMTWPHMMVRALCLEQIYRAQTILDGHPYHK